MIDRPRTEGGRSIASDTVETFLLKVALYGVRFGGSVAISRGLGPEGRGAYSLPVVAAETMVVLCKLGLEHANVVMRGSHGLSRDRLSAQNGLVALVMGTLGAAALLLAPSMLPGVFAGTPDLFLLLAGLTVPFALHTQLSAGLLTLDGQVTWQFRAALLAGVAQVTLLICLFFIQAFRVTPVLAVNLATVTLTWVLTVRRLMRKGAVWMRWDAGLLRDTFRQSLLLHVGMVLFFLHLRLDMFMVQGLAGTEALGQYSLSVVLAETSLLATDSLALAILPRQMGNSLEEAAAVGLHAARTNAVLGLGLAAIWGAGGSVVIRWCFGPKFAPAYLPLLGLLPGMVFLGMQRVCGGPALRAGKPGRITMIYAGSLLANGLLNLWCIPALGPLGAALASSVSYGLGAFCFLAWTAQLAGAPLSDAVVPRRSDVLALGEAMVQVIRLLKQAAAAYTRAP